VSELFKTKGGMVMQSLTTKVSFFGLVLFVMGGFLTKGAASPIPVGNPSFEDLGAPLNTWTPCRAPYTGCFYNFGAIPDWASSANNASGQQQPGTSGPYLSVPSTTIAFSNGATLSQTVAATVTPGVTYILTVELGHRIDDPFTASADLLVGTNVFTAIGTAPSAGNWSPFTAEFTGTAAEAGDPITIQLLSSGSQGAFDNVSLTASAAATPEPAYLGVVGIGLAGLLAFALHNRNA
jgi:hypothetical protein